MIDNFFTARRKVVKKFRINYELLAFPNYLWCFSFRISPNCNNQEYNILEIYCKANQIFAPENGKKVIVLHAQNEINVN